MKRAGKVVSSLLVAGAAFSSGYLMKATRAVRGKAEEEKSSSAELNRLNVCYDMLTRWMTNEREGLQIGKYLEGKGIHNVGIYGHGKVGILLYQTLKEEGIPVTYFSDIMTIKKFNGIDGVIHIPPQDMNKIPVDAIIITPCWDTEEIISGMEKILKKASFDVKYILPLNALLYDL